MTYTTEIVYNVPSRDYDMRLNGEYIGSRATYHDAELALDNLVYTILNHTPDAITDSVDPEDNRRCGDCGAALGDYGLCEACSDNAEPEPGIDPGDHGGPSTIGRPLTWTEQKIAAGSGPLADEDDRSLAAALMNLRARAAVEPTPDTRHLKPDTHSCPSCEAPMHAPGMCPSCRTEAAQRLYDDDGYLLAPAAAALAVAGAG